MIILNTSVLIGLLQGKSEIINLLKDLNQDRFAISIVTLAEIEFGFHFLSSKIQIETKEKIESLVDNKIIHIFPVDRKVAFVFGKIQAELKNKGNVLSQFDGVIAATAIAFNCQLFTTDEDFRRVNGLKLIYPK
jgi:predicted nucleic acid-binding protein